MSDQARPASAHDRQPDPQRIDVHFHTIPHFFRDAVIAAGRGPTISSGFPAWTPDASLQLMDRHGIAAAILSVSQPGVHFGDDAAAAALARRCNDYMAGLIRDRPTRFGAFATVSLPDVDAACKEVAYALDTLKLDGVCLLASYGERFLGDPHFEPLMAELSRRRAVVFIHPNFHPSSRTIQLPYPAFMMEFLFDTTRAAANLVFSGTLDRYPDIRFILAHAGGALPYISWRMSVSPVIDPRLPRLSPDDIMERLGRFWYDTAISAGPSTFGSLDAVARPDRIVFGSDWPYAPESVTTLTVDALTQPDHFDAKRQQAIARDNALPLFPRFAR